MAVPPPPPHTHTGLTCSALLTAPSPPGCLRASQVENDPETNEVLYEKTLTFYELDLGLNHVVRKWSDAVDPTSNMLIAVPGGTDGPGGVLVCAENFIVYKNHGHEDRRCALPRRRDLPTEHGLLLVSSAVHRQRDLFFILVQSELGDLYKVTLAYADENVSEVKVRCTSNNAMPHPRTPRRCQPPPAPRPDPPPSAPLPPATQP